MERKCPIIRLSKEVLEAEDESTRELDRIEAEGDLDEAIEFARESALPDATKRCRRLYSRTNEFFASR